MRRSEKLSGQRCSLKPCCLNCHNLRHYLEASLQTSSSHLGLVLGLGWCYCLETSGSVELSAQVWGMMWIRQSPFKDWTINYDSTYGESMDASIASPKTHFTLVGMTSGLRLLVEQCGECCAQHIRSHEGQPWNELADVICTFTSLGYCGFHGECIVPVFVPQLVSAGYHSVVWFFRFQALEC